MEMVLSLNAVILDNELAPTKRNWFFREEVELVRKSPVRVL